MAVPLTPDLVDEIAQLLGREPRGLRDVPILSQAGQPQVIRVASIVDGKPFPTLFWLIDPAICLRIDREEASGLITVFQERVDSDPTLRAKMIEDHRSHIALRDSFLTDEERQVLDGSGFGVALTSRGIGGIAGFSFSCPPAGGAVGGCGAAAALPRGLPGGAGGITGCCNI